MSLRYGTGVRGVFSILRFARHSGSFRLAHSLPYSTIVCFDSVVGKHSRVVVSRSSTILESSPSHHRPLPHAWLRHCREIGATEPAIATSRDLTKVSGGNALRTKRRHDALG
jgi:hypothetical protein